jgi:hypothetical protein
MAEAWQLKAVLSANSAGMVNALNAVSKQARITRKYLLDVGKSAGKLGGQVGLPIAAISGAMAGFSVMGIKNAITGFAQLGETVYNAAKRTGMTVEEIQRMKYVSEQAGVPMEALEGSIGKLNVNMSKAAGGKNKSLANLLKALHISARDANGEIRSGIEVLPELADGFKRNTNEAVRAEMGMALFGKGYQQLMPMLVEGSEGLNESLERFKILKGVGMDKATITDAKDLNKDFKDLNIITKSFSMTIGKDLAPIIGPMVKDFNKWALAHRQIISTKIKEFVIGLGTWIKSIDWGGVVKSIETFGARLGWVVDHIGGAKVALIALALVMNAQTIMAMYGLAAASWRLGAHLLAMSATAIPAAVGWLSTLTMAMMSANAGGFSFLGTIGLLIAKLGLLAVAAGAGYVVGGLLNDHVINSAVKALTGGKHDSLGSMAAGNMPDGKITLDDLNRERAAAGRTLLTSLPWDQGRPSLVTPAGKQEVGGKFTFDFQNAPPGMRLTNQETRGKTDIDMSMGYRSFATGMP